MILQVRPDGGEGWSRGFDEPVAARPDHAHDQVVAIVGNRRVVGLDAATGDERWTWMPAAATQAITVTPDAGGLWVHGTRPGETPYLAYLDPSGRLGHEWMLDVAGGWVVPAWVHPVGDGAIVVGQVWRGANQPVLEVGLERWTHDAELRWRTTFPSEERLASAGTPDGDVYVLQTQALAPRLVRFDGGDGTAAEPIVLPDGFRPSTVAVHPHRGEPIVTGDFGAFDRPLAAGDLLVAPIGAGDHVTNGSSP